ncbi:MAG: hypothetical protein NTU79_09055 [Planctomycetota bacterium]|nr:hypothetical protein [Planctomycetota bacterium]
MTILTHLAVSKSIYPVRRGSKGAGPFMDTAAMMMNLDLGISSPHLAGGLGRPVWLAKNFNSDWRWRSDERGANP